MAVCIRNQGGGMDYRCGYVQIKSNHPLFLEEGDDFQDGPGGELEVHGGVTWTGEQPVAGWDYCVGFDCAHAGDMFMDEEMQDKLGRIEGDDRTHKSLQFVVEECERLAEQLAVLDPWNF